MRAIERDSVTNNILHYNALHISGEWMSIGTASRTALMAVGCRTWPTKGVVSYAGHDDDNAYGSANVWLAP